MNTRLRVYRRIQNVLAGDQLKVTTAGVREIEDALRDTLSEYMKVSDMHISFKRLTDGQYGIKIEGLVSGAIVPHIL